VANVLDLFRNGAVGFIDWLDLIRRNRPKALKDVSEKALERNVIVAPIVVDGNAKPMIRSDKRHGSEAKMILFVVTREQKRGIGRQQSALGDEPPMSGI
jgi:hypothetical protein